MPILSLFTLPFRAPLLGGLFLVALVMGNHWTVNQSIYAQNQSISVSVFWLIQLIQVIAVVVVFPAPAAGFRYRGVVGRGGSGRRRFGASCASQSEPFGV